MAEVTNISWTDATINFWTGCKKVSTECKFCYMYRDKERKGLRGDIVIKSNINNVHKTLKKLTTPSLIFTCSWSDFFIEEADEWRAEAWEIIKANPQHQWQILTKRPERILQCLPSDWGENGYDNVWLGVSIGDISTIERLEILRNIPCKIRFVSSEPLLSAIPNLDLTNYQWLIIGGESGNETGKYRYRECKKEWILDLIEQGKNQNVAVFVKQMGTFIAKKDKLTHNHGADINEWLDKSLKIREFPKY